MFKLAFRYIKSNIKSSFRSVFGIAFSVMLMFSLVQISSSVMDRFEKAALSGLRRDFTVYNISPKKLIKLHKDVIEPPLNSNQRVMSIIWVGSVYEDDLEAFKILGIDGDINYFKSTQMYQGSMAQLDNEIVIEKSYASSHGNLKPGDEISLEIFYATKLDEIGESIEHTFKISGIINDVVDSGTYFFTNLSGAEKLLNETGLVFDDDSNSMAYESSEGEYDTDMAVASQFAIKELYLDGNSNSEDEKFFFKNHILDNESKDALYADKGSYTTTAFGISIISVVIAICMTIFIYNVLNSNLLGKIDSISTMRCIGLNNSQLSSMLFSEVFIFTNIGILIGFISGNLLNYLTADKLISLLLPNELEKTELSQNTLVYAMTYFLTFVASMCACLRLILKIYKLKPVNIKKYGTVIIKPKIQSEKIINHNKYLSGVAKRNIKRNFNKSFIQIITVALSFLLCFIICNVFTVIGNGTNKSLADICDYSIISAPSELMNEIDESEKEMICSKYSVSEVYTEKSLYQYKTNIKDLRTVVYSDNLIKVLTENLDLKYNKDEEFAVLFTNNDTKINTLQLNSEDKTYNINLNNCYSSENTFSFASYAGISGNSLVINSKTAAKIDVDAVTYSSLLIKTDEKITKSDLSDILGNDILFEDMNEGKSESKNQLLGMIILAGYIVSATVFISFLIIGSSIRENVILRKREYGIMRSIGMKISELCKIYCIENFILTIVSCVPAMVVSVFINIYLSIIMFDEIRISIPIYILVFVVFIIVIELFTYCYMKKYMNNSIVDVMRYE